MTHASVTPHGLADELARAGVTDVLADDASRAHYSSDASLYRLVPTVVVRPRESAEVEATLAVARGLGVPVVARGAGTSVAGNAIGTGIVVDFSRHMDAILGVDPEARTARVQPGVVQARLQDAVGRHGLLFGPDPSTMSRCTIGGMLGNNACGSRSLGYGRTSDNVIGMRLLLADGSALEVGSLADPAARPDVRLERLRALVRDNLATVRTELGRFGRQVSGYSLEHLLPEADFDVARFLVGTEGTLAVATEAEVRLVAAPACTRLVVLGFAGIADAGEATPDVLRHRPTACEGLDARIVDVVRLKHGDGAVPDLPRGAAWLFVELAGASYDEVDAEAARLVSSVAALGAVDARVVTETGEVAALWRIRADGAGLSGRSSDNRPAHAGWEDAAVPPEALGRYLRRFDDLLGQHGLSGFPFGHFGDGCLHVRLDFPLDRTGGPARFRAFLEDAARLVAEFGGSLSGEHGDGRARSELLPTMYSADALRLFAGVKEIFDPANLLNPGVLVDPEPVDRSLRVPAAREVPGRLAFAYADDGGSFSQAVHRCTGVGKCRSDNDHGVMCPSFVATRDEKDSTRGRARVLQELANGSLVTGWSSRAIHDSLDLCLSCKGCASDCPTGIDMATYKSEVLHQTYRRRLRPITHYSLGWLPRWARLASVAPGLANRMMASPRLSRLAMRMAGVDDRRRLPTFAAEPFRRRRGDRRTAPDGRPAVVLFVDTFSEYFSPEAARATVRVLEAAGHRVDLLPRRRCCGLTWITTGQLDAARRLLEATVADLRPYADAGVPIVGIEPSCTAVLRHDAVELLRTPEAEAVAGDTFTLAELLERSGWSPPDLGGLEVVAQPHCHHHAVLGWDADRRLLERANARLTALAGCCGLAGNFGVERGHYETSVAVAEQHLLPAVRRQPDAVVLADGFSCRTQLADLADRRGRHLAEVLADALPADEVAGAGAAGGAAC